MTPQDFLRLMEQKQREVQRCVQRVIPVKVGRIAKNHFQDNFRKGGFVNGGLHRWKPSKRIGKAKGAKGQYGTLLSDRKHLYSSIQYVPGNAEVHIQNKVPYAAVHNEGLRAGRGKGFQMPKRQFIGPSKELDQQVLYCRCKSTNFESNSQQEKEMVQGNRIKMKQVLSVDCLAS